MRTLQIALVAVAIGSTTIANAQANLELDKQLAEIRKKADAVPHQGPGTKLGEIKEGSTFAKLGLKSGDVLVQIDGCAFGSQAEWLASGNSGLPTRMRATAASEVGEASPGGSPGGGTT